MLHHAMPKSSLWLLFLFHFQQQICSIPTNRTEWCLHGMILQRFEAPSSEDSSSESYETGSESGSGSESSSLVTHHAQKKRKLQPRSSSGSSSCHHAQSSGLAFGQLAAMTGMELDENESVYAQKAKDPKRVKRVLNEPCCRAQCKKGLRFKLVMRMIAIFWALPKVSQDCVLWSIQQTGSSHSAETDDDSEEDERWQHKISWSIEGVLFFVIVHCFDCQLLQNVPSMKKPRLWKLLRLASLPHQLLKTAWHQRLTPGENTAYIQRCWCSNTWYFG